MNVNNMPMNGDVILCIVGNVDKNSISFSCINGGSWKPSIHCDNGFCMAKPAHILHSYLKSNVRVI